MSTDDADEDLIVLYPRGDLRATGGPLSRAGEPVYNFILRFVGDRETAEDLLQETFLRVIKGAEAYQRQAKFTTWLYTIARNLCVDATRRRKHRKAMSLDVPVDADAKEGPTLLDVVADGKPATDRKVLARELHGRLEIAIARLSEDQREVFLMR